MHPSGSHSHLIFSSFFLFYYVCYIFYIISLILSHIQLPHQPDSIIYGLLYQFMNRILIIVGYVMMVAGSGLMQIVNRVMELNHLPHSIEIQQCLSVDEQRKGLQVLNKFAQDGAYAASTHLPEVLSRTLHRLQASVSASSWQCLNGCNDLTLLLWKYRVNPSEVVSSYHEYAKVHFLSSHYLFTNLSHALNQSSYDDAASVLHSMGNTFYSHHEVDDEWVIRAESVERLDEYYGVSLSNGLMGVVSSREPLQVGSTVLAGVYDKVGRGRVDNLVRTFAPLDMSISLNGNTGGFYNIIQQLNMKEASITHSVSCQQFSLQYTSYALKNLPSIFYTEFKLVPHTGGSLEISNMHEIPSWLSVVQKSYQNIDSGKGVYRILSSTAQTANNNIKMSIASCLLAEGGEYLHENWDEKMHLQKVKLRVDKGQMVQFRMVSSLMGSVHHSDVQNQVIRLLVRAVSMKELVRGHRERWAELWQDDIIIEGNVEDQKNIRSMLYHCYAFIDGNRYGVSPMGLSGDGYNGHVFWDMDLWIYPSILALKPSLAKPMLQYRYERLQAGRKNAELNGYSGAMYPWESSLTGQEETPVWALSGPLQHHVSGCVAFAAWNYYALTQDVQWLNSTGYPIIQAVAQFYASRVQEDANGSYHIYNVVGADEWAENVDDDAFTNAIAKVILLLGNKAAQVVNLAGNKEWERIGSKIVILKMQNNVTREHATYEGQNIKQADVNLLAFPLKYYTQPSDILRDLHFYETRIPDAGTPAMTFSIFTILYSRLGDMTKAYENFHQSYEEFVKKPFNVMSETKGGTNPYFLTGAGGVLQSVIFGFGGYDITQKGLVIKPNKLPSQWSKLTIKSSRVKQMIVIQ